MSTINDASIIKQMILNGGVYPGDPPCTKIYAYRSTLGQSTVFKCFWKPGQILEDSEYVLWPTLLFDLDEGITKEGELFLEQVDKYETPGNRKLMERLRAAF